MTSTEEDDTDSAPSSMSTAFFNISVDVRYSNHKMSGVVCVKRGPVVEAEKALSTQLRLMTLSEGRNLHLPGFLLRAKLYIPSTLNIALLQWHTHLNVCAVK